MEVNEGWLVETCSFKHSHSKYILLHDAALFRVPECP